MHKLMIRKTEEEGRRIGHHQIQFERLRLTPARAELSVISDLDKHSFARPLERLAINEKLGREKACGLRSSRKTGEMDRKKRVKSKRLAVCELKIKRKI